MIETGKQLAQAALAVAREHKTVYGLGCFGWPMTAANKKRAIAAYSYNAQADRAVALNAADESTFAFDCVGLIKALLWGWSGEADKSYGGAVYGANGVPDKSADQTIALCNGVSTDFSSIQPGEAVWRSGHIGIYIGDGLAVECTPKWSDGVQITAVLNLGSPDGFHGRTWTSHGRLPWIRYEEAQDSGYSLYLPMARKGDSGQLVKAWQLLLMGSGYSCGSPGADGKFGAATQQAVRQFQEDQELAVDGIVGPATAKALLGVCQ